MDKQIAHLATSNAYGGSLKICQEEVELARNYVYLRIRLDLAMISNGDYRAPWIAGYSSSKMWAPSGTQPTRKERPRKVVPEMSEHEENHSQNSVYTIWKPLL